MIYPHICGRSMHMAQLFLTCSGISRVVVQWQRQLEYQDQELPTCPAPPLPQYLDKRLRMHAWPKGGLQLKAVYEVHKCILANVRVVSPPLEQVWKILI